MMPRLLALAVGAALALAGSDPIQRKVVPGEGRGQPDEIRALGYRYRPPIRGTQAVVAAGNPLSAMAGMRILERGGNAIDAGVAAMLAAATIEQSHYGMGGEVPILIRRASTGDIAVINGQGTAPAAATRELFEARGGIPSTGPLAATMPGVLDAAVTALDRYGTLGLGDVMGPAVELADGFVVYDLFAGRLERARRELERYPATIALFAPGGRPLQPGDILRQPRLAATYRAILDAERRAAPGGRHAALIAARDYFYKGPVATSMVRALRAAGGIQTEGDFASFSAKVEKAATITYHEYEIVKPGPWTQGPALLEMLNLLEAYDLHAMGHNSPDYIHTVTEAMKLAFADRDRYYGDPDFVKVPLTGLLSKRYAAERRKLIDPARASLEQQPGDPYAFEPTAAPPTAPAAPSYSIGPAHGGERDTTCINVVDREGNMFSATPSGSGFSFMDGESGVPFSERMQSFVMTAGAQNVVAPGKRPRITLSPTLVLKNGRPFMALSTAGGDNQDQALLMVLLNVVQFGMNPQEAIEAPRFTTAHLVNSFARHEFLPGSLELEGRIPPATAEELKRRGHRVTIIGDWETGSQPTAIHYDAETKVITGGADVRRDRYVVGW